MRYCSAVQQARARVADQLAYRQIAAKAAAAQTDTAVALAAISATLANVQARLSAGGEGLEGRRVAPWA